jgi:hypothetical protein
MSQARAVVVMLSRDDWVTPKEQFCRSPQYAGNLGTS